jgi:hypothetical protein
MRAVPWELGTAERWAPHLVEQWALTMVEHWGVHLAALWGQKTAARWVRRWAGQTAVTRALRKAGSKGKHWAAWSEPTMAGYLARPTAECSVWRMAGRSADLKEEPKAVRLALQRAGSSGGSSAEQSGRDWAEWRGSHSAELLAKMWAVNSEQRWAAH